MVREKRKHSTRRTAKGAVLSLIVMLTLLLALASLALAQLGQQSRLRTIRSTAAMTARLAADAGIERALFLMNEQLEAGTWTLDDVPVFEDEPLPGCNAAYSVTFSGNLSGGYELVSTGVCGSQTMSIRVLIGLTSPFADNFAVLTEGQLTMKNKAAIDGYNSADPTERNVSVSIGTLSSQAGKIDIKNNSTVDGDVYVGPGGDPETVIDMKNRHSVTGELFTMAVPYPMPRINPPGFVASKGSIRGNLISLQTSDSGKYTDISINNNGKLVINGNLVLHITGDIELKNGSEVVVNNGSTLNLYVDGDIDGKNSSGINSKRKIPADVRIYGTGSNQSFEFKNSSDLYASIYAPNADMILHNGGSAYGSFITETFEMKNSGSVFYDKALKNVKLTDEGIRFVVLQWEEL